MKLKLRVKGLILKKVSEIINDFDDNASFICSSSGISFQALDSDNLIVALFVGPNGFQHYSSNSKMDMGMDSYDLVNLLNRANDDDIITMRANDSCDTVKLTFRSPGQGLISKFEMTREDITPRRYKDETKDVEYLASVKMPSSEFYRIFNHINSISKIVVISLSEEGVKFSTKGYRKLEPIHIFCSQNTDVPNPEEATVINMNNMNETVSMSMKITWQYIDSFMKATTLSKTVSIILLNEMSVLIEYNIAEGEMGYVRFYFPPAYDSSEDEDEDEDEDDLSEDEE